MRKGSFVFEQGNLSRRASPSQIPADLGVFQDFHNFLSRVETKQILLQTTFDREATPADQILDLPTSQPDREIGNIGKLFGSFPPKGFLLAPTLVKPVWHKNYFKEFM
jgi:hypothetical protein